jgi:tetratricopeptide (TPR) repeat protein
METMRIRLLFHTRLLRRYSCAGRRNFGVPLLLGRALLLGATGRAELNADAVIGLKQIVYEFDDTPSKDLLLADQGYKALSEGNYHDAETYLNSALDANPSNPYALLNMGVVYENTQRLDQAREMYARVVLIDPQSEAKESTDEGMVGAPLAEIARQNLVRLNARTKVPEDSPQFSTGAARLDILEQLLEAGLISANEFAARAPSKDDPRLPQNEVLPPASKIVNRLASLELYRQTELISNRAYDFERSALLDALLPIAPAPAPAPTATAPEATSAPEVLVPTQTSAAPPAPATSSGDMRVHIASYSSVEDAKLGWAELQQTHEDLLGPLSLDIAEVDLGPDQGIYYRVQACPVGDVEAAKALCAQLESREHYCAPAI